MNKEDLRIYDSIFFDTTDYGEFAIGQLQQQPFHCYMQRMSILHRQLKEKRSNTKTNEACLVGVVDGGADRSGRRCGLGHEGVADARRHARPSQAVVVVSFLCVCVRLSFPCCEVRWSERVAKVSR